MMQEIIVGIIVLCCMGIAISRIAQYFKRIKRKDNPCEGCSGCDLYKKKQENCGKSRPKVW